MGVLRKYAGRFSKASRRRKIDWFCSRLEPGSSVLFVGIAGRGGTTETNMVETSLARDLRAVGLVYDPPEGDRLRGSPVVRADGRRLPFADRSFDYVVSNAVIEHLGGPGGARELVRESRRVASEATFHCTPDRWFPIETHTLVPVLHWLPRRFQERTFKVVGKRFPTERYWIFGKRELRQLAGHAARINAMTLVTEWRRSGD